MEIFVIGITRRFFFFFILPVGNVTVFWGTAPLVSNLPGHLSSVFK